MIKRIFLALLVGSQLAQARPARSFPKRSNPASEGPGQRLNTRFTTPPPQQIVETDAQCAERQRSEQEVLMRRLDAESAVRREAERRNSRPESGNLDGISRILNFE